MKPQRIYLLILLLHCIALCNAYAQTTILEQQYTSIKNMETNELTQTIAELKALVRPNEFQQALYAILHFEHLDKNDSTLQPDSLISSAITHLQNAESPYLATALFQKARIQYHNRKFEQATRLYLQAEKLAYDIPDHALLAYTYADIGNVYFEQKNYTKARTKYEKAKEYYQLTGHTQHALSIQLNIASTYSAEENYTLALQQTLALALTPQVKHDSILWEKALSNLASIYWHTEQYDSAKQYMKQIIKLTNKKNHTYTNFQIAHIYYKQEKNDSARHYALKVVAEKGSAGLHKACYGMLANIAYRENNHTAQAHYLVKRDSCNNLLLDIQEQTPAHIIEQQIKQKEQVAHLKKMSIIFGILGSMSLLTYLLYMYKERKRMRQYIHMGKQLEISSKNIRSYQEKIKLLKENEEIAEQLKDQQLEELKIQLVQNQERQEQLTMQRKKIMRLATNSINDKIELLAKDYRKQKSISYEEALCQAYQKQLSIDNNTKLLKWLNQQFENVGKKLLYAHPSLTERDMQMLTLIFLHTSHKNISTVLNISINSIGKTQIRLAQKLGKENTDAIREHVEKLITL